MQQQQWRLGDVTWRLVYTLQKAADTRATLTPQGLISRLAPASAPDASAKPAAPIAASSADASKGSGEMLCDQTCNQCNHCMSDCPLHSSGGASLNFAVTESLTGKDFCSSQATPLWFGV